MIKRLLPAGLLVVGFVFITNSFSQEAAPASPKNPPAKPAATASIKKSAAPAPGKIKTDTLKIEARLTEIPGKFPPNDLYNYVYIMKYHVISVVKGTYANPDILVGVYNPLIARKQIKDKMAKAALGSAEKFEEGARHTLTLIKPIEAVWKDAIEDEYFDTDLAKYYALKVDLSK